MSATRRFRVIDGEVREVTDMALPSKTGGGPPIVSDALGFPKDALPARRQQLQEMGIRGIEFKQDPQVPEFYQVHGSSRAALERYCKRRNMVNRGSTLGATVMLSEEDFERAKELVSR